ncbi:hypothetical protein MUP01_12465 [Candidatus Bathyarchaeota archaeon]|nr:hypothetical protein [Candidatus Bathyarchaeota archaeon]
MTDGYGQPPAQQSAGGGQVAVQGQGQYLDDYDYYGNTFRGMGPSDQAAQVRKAIFDCALPEKDSDFGEWIPMLAVAVDMVCRIPGVDHTVINELNLRMELIVDRAHSQGRKRSVAAKMQKLIFRLRSYVSMGDTPLAGITGVTAMITTNQKQDQTIRMPQQPATTNSIWPWGGKK